MGQRTKPCVVGFFFVYFLLDLGGDFFWVVWGGAC